MNLSADKSPKSGTSPRAEHQLLRNYRNRGIKKPKKCLDPKYLRKFKRETSPRLANACMECDIETWRKCEGVIDGT